MPTPKQSKLYSLLGDFEVFSHFSVDRLSTRDATNMPFMTWPNGSPCLIGNLYMQSLFLRRGRGKQGLSRKGQKGGSMGDYAAKVSQLLRYLYIDKIDPIDLTDGKFSKYIDTIRKETSPHNPLQPKKSQNSVIATGRTWLDFLSFVGRFHGDDKFVSSTGAIRATEESYSSKSKSGRKISHNYLHHHSFGEKCKPHSRNPISKEQIDLLKGAIRKSKSPAFVKVRSSCLIDLLNDTGARREEIVNLRVDDVLKAMEMEHPLLRLDTLKREEGAERFVPVFSTALKKLRQYIDVERRKVMRSVYKGGKDHGYFFVSATTGKQLTTATVSNEVLKLRKLAGIKSQVTAHMFRHAFITNLFILLIQRHQFTNSDQFRQALLDSHTFIAEITSWTGHLDGRSIEHYLKVAFRDLANYKETVSSVHSIMAVRKYMSEQSELVAMLNEGMPVDEYTRQYEALKEMAEKDLKIAEHRESLLLRR